ncbi:putative zinc finger, AN1-type domain 6 [Monocercomonoides exilis]|uniref:putative zinc finger, AN1-type domain 6 n=1 Tax=Monocercomonoides exilis TaxID=2049356 RepID=UPI00355A6670|nr:putative zinc finger, AN1-type domain 6 [Monocercomonoides exilis]|eukprot:MONOS_9348.1-p1 / transcript=MONOS_9348.1 / gene=MONOS_9348 / organism=Monocercomonoides_exilis_PA203 / gene_product=zinc finger, AN1-type domain 6 / transcript_product=zinc finger, AN1-type domain 6 / location=Mono_scaffold00383:347-940(-) / protein_length=197 / sequence_SO=supercontig / SO=protein_coding / is_pseudo=false
MSSTQQPSSYQEPSLCKAGCGFYGSAATLGMCSKCYREYQQKQQHNRAEQPEKSEGVNSDFSSSTIQKSSSSSLKESVSPISSQKSSNFVNEEKPADLAIVNRRENSKIENETSTASQLPNHSTEKSSSAGLFQSTKCAFCKKKLGFMSFDCSCGLHFCSAHRFPESHNCTYDWKQSIDPSLIKLNPKLEAEKISKI